MEYYSLVLLELKTSYITSAALKSLQVLPTISTVVGVKAKRH